MCCISTSLYICNDGDCIGTLNIVEFSSRFKINRFPICPSHPLLLAIVQLPIDCQPRNANGHNQRAVAPVTRAATRISWHYIASCTSLSDCSSLVCIILSPLYRYTAHLTFHLTHPSMAFWDTPNDELCLAYSASALTQRRGAAAWQCVACSSDIMCAGRGQLTWWNGFPCKEENVSSLIDGRSLVYHQLPVSSLTQSLYQVTTYMNCFVLSSLEMFYS